MRTLPRRLIERQFFNEKILSACFYHAAKTGIFSCKKRKHYADILSYVSDKINTKIGGACGVP
jgi:hypothetical protein